MRRFYINQDLGFDVAMEGGEHNHLANVLRMKVGDMVVLFCGDEYDYTYEITYVTRDYTNLRFVSRAKNIANPAVNLVVFLGVIKLDNLSLVVEKLNELGVGELVPFVCANSNIPAKAINTEKLEIVAKQSCKQCGRSIPLKVHHTLRFNEMLDKMSKFDMAFYADRGEKFDRVYFSEVQNANHVAVIIGPEGGFTIDESSAVTQLARPVTLGSRTLRSETAAMAASTILLSMMGEM